MEIHDRLAAEMPQHKPEAVSVLVLTPDAAVAELVAPYVARELYPGRTFGETLHVEWVAGAQPGFQCAVRVK
jgi:hypothetical protein